MYIGYVKKRKLTTLALNSPNEKAPFLDLRDYSTLLYVLDFASGVITPQGFLVVFLVVGVSVFCT